MGLENPFKGPSPYKEGDKLVGRDTEKYEAYSLINSDTLTLLYARSGTGKTSLLRAGIIPLMRESGNYLPVYIRLNPSVLYIDDKTRISIRQYIIKKCTEEINNYLKKPTEPNLDLGADIPQSQAFGPNRDSLFEYLTRLQLENKAKGIQVKLLLVFDQFEEIFTTELDKKELELLLLDIDAIVAQKIPHEIEEKNTTYATAYAELYNKIETTPNNVKIVFSFREEYLSRFHSLRDKVPAVVFTKSLLQIEPFSLPTAEHIITELAPEISEPNRTKLVEELASPLFPNLNKRVIDPFIFSLVCYKSYNTLVAKPAMTDTAVRDLVKNSVEGYIDDIYPKISNSTKKFIEDQLISTDKKRTLISYSDIETETIRKDVDKLIGDSDMRLLNKEPYLGNADHIEILHDKLAEPIVKKGEQRRYWDRVKRGAWIGAIVLISLFTAGIIADRLITLKNEANEATAKSIAKEAQAKKAEAEAELNKINALRAQELAKRAEQNAYEASKAAEKEKKDADKAKADNRDLSAKLTDREDKIRTDSIKTVEMLTQQRQLADFNVSLIKDNLQDIKDLNPFSALDIAYKAYYKLLEIGIKDDTLLSKYDNMLVETYNTTELFGSQYVNDTALPYYYRSVSTGAVLGYDTNNNLKLVLPGGEGFTLLTDDKRGQIENVRYSVNDQMKIIYTYYSLLDTAGDAYSQVLKLWSLDDIVSNKNLNSESTYYFPTNISFGDVTRTYIGKGIVFSKTDYNDPEYGKIKNYMIFNKIGDKFNYDSLSVAGDYYTNVLSISDSFLIIQKDEQQDSKQQWEIEYNYSITTFNRNTKKVALAKTFFEYTPMGVGFNREIIMQDKKDYRNIHLYNAFTGEISSAINFNRDVNYISQEKREDILIGSSDDYVEVKRKIGTNWITIYIDTNSIGLFNSSTEYFSNDNNKLAIGNGRSITILDLLNKEETKTAYIGYSSFGFSTDDSILIVSDYKRLTPWYYLKPKEIKGIEDFERIMESPYFTEKYNGYIKKPFQIIKK